MVAVTTLCSRPGKITDNDRQKQKNGCHLVSEWAKPAGGPAAAAQLPPAGESGASPDKSNIFKSQTWENKWQQHSFLSFLQPNSVVCTLFFEPCQTALHTWELHKPWALLTLASAIVFSTWQLLKCTLLATSLLSFVFCSHCTFWRPHFWWDSLMLDFTSWLYYQYNLPYCVYVPYIRPSQYTSSNFQTKRFNHSLHSSRVATEYLWPKKKLKD